VRPHQLLRACYKEHRLPATVVQQSWTTTHVDVGACLVLFAPDLLFPIFLGSDVRLLSG